MSHRFPWSTILPLGPHCTFFFYLVPISKYSFLFLFAKGGTFFKESVLKDIPYVIDILTEWHQGDG